MSPTEFLNTAIRPALLKLPPKMRSREAEAMLLAICLQESELKHRKQINGPARGYAQFELSGGVQGVLTHPATTHEARAICAILDAPAQPEDIYEAIAWHDVLAMVFARLLLWQHKETMPSERDSELAWQIYLDQWDAGKPRPQAWAANWQKAWETVG